jgi:hypothetical protein
MKRNNVDLIDAAFKLNQSELVGSLELRICSRM